MFTPTTHHLLRVEYQSISNPVPLKSNFCYSYSRAISSLAMAPPSATEEMERLQLSDEDTEELWNSPSQRRTRPTAQRTPSSADRLQDQSAIPILDPDEAREFALRNELQTVRNVNHAIEGVLESLERARGNMEVCNYSPCTLAILCG